MAAQRIDLLFCNFPTPFFPDFGHFAEPGNFTKMASRGASLRARRRFFGKSDSTRWIANITRSDFGKSTYFFVIFRRRFFRILIILRSRENSRKWRPATKPPGHGAVFLEIGLNALNRKCHANWL